MTNPSERELVLRNCRTDFYGDEILAEAEKFDAMHLRRSERGNQPADSDSRGVWPDERDF